MTKAVAFVAHLPVLSDIQALKVQNWAHDRATDARLMPRVSIGGRSPGYDLYVVLAESRNQKALQNLLNTNLKNLAIKRPKFER